MIKDIKKISRFIFVTSQKVTGVKMDKLRKLIKNHYGWNLVIYSREWLRLQLEESSKDIASKYLGIPTPSYQGHNMLLSKIDVSQEEISELICDEKYEMAILALKNLLENSDRLEEVHNGLARCYYGIYDYKNALIHIDLALRSNPASIISKSIKGCILAEDGIATNSKTKLLLAKKLFNYIVEIDKNRDSCYNLANTLSALGEYENAKKLNIESLKFDNKRAFVWKNLGTCYFHLNDHKKELVCMDIALSIDPDLPEALISKGVTLGVVYKNYVDGLDLINSALEKDKSLAYRWPYVYYWKSIFLSNLNNIPEALTQLEEGLTISPSNLYLLNLKAELLSQLWKTDANFLSRAAEFFEFRIKINEGEQQSIRELALIYNEMGLNSKFNDYAIRFINIFTKPSFCLERADIATLEISKVNLISLINNIYEYSVYRESCSIDEYINGYADNFKLGLDKIFWTYYGFIFANTCDAIQERREMDVLSWNEIAELNQSSMIHELPIIIRVICKKYNKCLREERVNLMGEIISNLSDFCLIETSREIGYLAGYNGESKAEIDNCVSNSNIGDWYCNVIETIISNLNRELNLFKENDCENLIRAIVNNELI